LAAAAPATTAYRPAGGATIFSGREGQFPFVDSVGEQMIGNGKIKIDGFVLKGGWWHPT